jgi:hypothetical protein
MRLRSLLLLPGVVLVLGPGRAGSEPMFLSKQYARCSSCHYSATGGGLLTPYGRSLSAHELSTTGAPATAGAPVSPGEEAFLWGILGHRLGALDLGIDLRPSRLHLDLGGLGTDRNLLMTSDLLAAFRKDDWTVYAELGREPLASGSKIDSYEYWVARSMEHGLGVRVGRFLPAYGVRLADHTAYTRAGLGFDKYDQAYALELSRTGERTLTQVSVGPGPADAVLHDDGRRAFTATARFETDLGPRKVLVVSGLFRGSSRVQPQNAAGGLAFGFAPTPHLSVWTEADARFQRGSAGPPAYILLNETAFEVYRGLWLKFSPQIRTAVGDASGGFLRLAFEADLLPRTHWNLDVSYLRDRNRVNHLVTKTVLAQLHLYL